MNVNFDFGANWRAFSADRMDAERVRAAVESLTALVGSDEIKGKSFLDVGCGSGLFSIAASSAGARTVRAFDVNATAVATSQRNAQTFLPSGAPVPDFREGSILSQDFLQEVGQHDVVYAWGSLHHTGAMWQAIRNAAALVAPNGLLVLAIYNAHWSSGFWKVVKRTYNVSPGFVRRLMNGIFGAAMYGAVWAVARENPMKKERGMDFWYDVVDWLGGYPFEVASAQQIRDFLQPLGFEMKHLTAPRVPTGCNEFVFQRVGGNR
jgi:2-polyprenyl-6-hydroxyphenyl methylase/3-demethylubiquinone-9 3-methyltransferase